MDGQAAVRAEAEAARAAKMGFVEGLLAEKRAQVRSVVQGF